MDRLENWSMIIKMEAMMLRNTHVQIEDQPIKGPFKMKLPYATQ